jgi:Protein of unknown function (DUF3147)
VLPTLDLGEIRQVQPKEYLLRFALGAAISIVAGIIGKTVSARFGGAFLAFPSILPASLTLLEEKEGTRRAGRNAIGAVLGSLGLVVFAMIGEAAFGQFNPVIVLLLAAAGWILTSFALYGVLAFLKPDTCDQTRD